MSEPEIGGREPVAVEVEGGKSYWWCACGRSKSQPFCDGSHKVTSFTPVEYVPERSRRLVFCACKRTGNRPLCDGTHKTLPAA
jgi:CDGSH-type Zn-finger protein